MVVKTLISRFLGSGFPKNKLSPHVDIQRQIDWYLRGTPSHLQNLCSNNSPELGLGSGGHGEAIAIAYRLTCQCGCQHFGVTAYLWQDGQNPPRATLSPVNASCESCGKQIVVFDSDLHGYDPVVVGSSTTAHGEREENAILHEIASLENPATVDIVAYYPDDLFEPDMEEFASIKRDLFTWLTIIVGEDTAPDFPLLDFECS